MNIMGTGTSKVVALCDIWEYARKKARTHTRPMVLMSTLTKITKTCSQKKKDLQASRRRHAGFLARANHKYLLKAGLHVYCEKMMSNTIEGARSMVKTMRETGKLLQIWPPTPQQSCYLFALKNRLLDDIKLCGADCRQRAVEPRRGAGFWLAKTFGHDAGAARQIWLQDMHQFRNWRWFKGLAAGRCPTSARIRLTFLTGGSA